MTEKEQITIKKFGEFVMKNNPSTEFLVQIFELSGMFLNLKTISDYSKENDLSYNGVKKCRDIKEIHGIKWVIDNY